MGHKILSRYVDRKLAFAPGRERVLVLNRMERGEN
jgi:hypothetical protein